MLRRMPFQPPTKYYCELLAPLDEQISALIAKRKELSQNNPGFPPLETIAEWCRKYGLTEDYMRSFFRFLFGEPHFLPVVEPKEFIKFVPILKAVQVENVIYSLTHMKQYSNASVVHLETEILTDQEYVQVRHASFDLAVSGDYTCRPQGVGGHGKGMHYSFVVSPRLPDETSGLEFHLSIKPIRDIPDIQEIVLTEASITFK